MTRGMKNITKSREKEEGSRGNSYLQNIFRFPLFVYYSRSINNGLAIFAILFRMHTHATYEEGESNITEQKHLQADATIYM